MQSDLEVVIDNALRVEFSRLPEPLRRKLLAALTIDNPAFLRARKFGRYWQHVPQVLRYYRREGDSLVLPRGFYRELRIAAHRDGLRLKPRDLRTTFPPLEFPELSGAVTLRPYQESVVSLALLREQGMIVAPTGSGKTVMGLEIVRRARQPALWITHTVELAKQALQKAATLLSLAAPDTGLIGDGACALGDKLTVALVQSLRRRDLDALVHRFGVVVCDEAHHAPAYTFSDVISRFPARYRYGLTATPQRSDGLGPVMFWIVGPPPGDEKIAPERLYRQKDLIRPRVIPLLSAFTPPPQDDFHTILSALVADCARNDLLVERITSEAAQGRKVLVLSERISHCESLARSLVERGVPAGLLLGRCTARERAATLAAFERAELSILVATSRLVGEGWDQPLLDCLVLTCPMRSPVKVKQAVGRVMRPHPQKKDALVIDIVDGRAPLLSHQFSARCREVYLPMGLAIDRLP
ncbi:MAG: DEAD/DEAH box helicase [Candidatus Schekmanbacteria bacterium]|nr:DEAD/DEAH box helicase [Candidatus Schekmanbacteria bacterium]